MPLTRNKTVGLFLLALILLISVASYATDDQVNLRSQDIYSQNEVEENAPTVENWWRAKQAGDIEKANRIQVILKEEAGKSWRFPMDGDVVVDLPYLVPPQNNNTFVRSPVWGEDVTITTGSVSGGMSTDYDASGSIYAARCTTYSGTENASIRVYKSTDGGVSWVYLCGFYNTGGNQYSYPVVLTGTSGLPEKLYIFYLRSDQNGKVGVARFAQNGTIEGFYSVKADDDTITYFTACANYGFGSYLMVAYQKDPSGSTTPDVYTIVSTDYGETWEGQAYITADGSHPDIAYGREGYVYLVYEKTGGSDDEIKFGRSTDYCSSTSWEYFEALTDDSWDDNYPKVAALHTSPGATPYVWVAYNHDYAGSGNIDLKFAYSSDGGVNWSKDHILANELNYNEMACDLWVGRNSNFTYVNICYLAYRGVSYYQRWYDIYFGIANTGAPSTWQYLEIINDLWGAWDHDGRNVCQGTYGNISNNWSGVVFAGQTLDVNYTDLYFDNRQWYEEALRGDANGDGIINVGDIVYLVSYLYRGDPAPNPLWVGDCNCDEIVDVGDIVYLVSYLYRGGPPPECP